MLADVIDLTVGYKLVATSWALTAGMATVPGASSAAATPRSLLQSGRKVKQTTKQQHPDPGAVFAFAVLQGVGRLRQRRAHKSGLNSGGTRFRLSE